MKQRKVLILKSFMRLKHVIKNFFFERKTFIYRDKNYISWCVQSRTELVTEASSALISGFSFSFGPTFGGCVLSNRWLSVSLEQSWYTLKYNNSTEGPERRAESSWNAQIRMQHCKTWRHSDYTHSASGHRPRNSILWSRLIYGPIYGAIKTVEMINDIVELWSWNST